MKAKERRGRGRMVGGRGRGKGRGEGGRVERGGRERWKGEVQVEKRGRSLSEDDVDYPGGEE